MPPKKILRNTRIPKPELKKNPKAPKVAAGTWDLYEHGVTYSTLSKFIVCRERFRIRYIEKLTSQGKKEAMEFGTIFHKALELSAGGLTPSQVFKKLHQMKSKGKRSREGFDPLLCRIASMMIPKYLEFWKEEFKEISYFETEKKFYLPYRCAVGKTVPIQGRRDQGFRKGGKIWLQENKTKGQVQEDQIIQTLGYMLQPMIYLLSFKLDHPKEKLGGVLYNVIRKPLLKQGKKESDSVYLRRIADDIDTRPDHYFKQFEIELDEAHLEEWRLKYFDPLICQLCMWWDSIKSNPFDPWVGEDGLPNPHHFIRPYGVYDPMSLGLGDYFLRVTQGHDAGLVRADSFFPELEDD